MFTKTTMAALLGLLLTGCAERVALQGMPEVADGGASRWIYHCTGGSVAVEYANRGGRYTATVETDDSTQVLDVVARSGDQLVAELPPLRWISRDGNLFSLVEGDRVLLDHCRAIAQQERGNMRVNLNGLFD